MSQNPGTLSDAINRLVIGDHLALFYETSEEEFAAVVPFIQGGLERGEQCLYIAHDNTPEQIRKILAASDIDIKKAEDELGILFIAPEEIFLHGIAFDPEKTVYRLEQAASKAKSAGFTALRIMTEMTWMPEHPPASERLTEYKMRLGQFLAKGDGLALCQYNLKRMPPPLLLEALHAHPTVIFGGNLSKNPYFIPPEDIPLTQRKKRELDSLLNSMLSREHIQQELQHKNELLEQAVNRLEADFTSLKENKENLQRMEEILWVTLEALPVGVWIISKEGEILHGNAAARQIWGGVRHMKIDNMMEIYKTWRLETGERITEQEGPAFRAHRKGEKLLNEELEIESFDGQRKIILSSALPLRNAQQEISGAVLVNEDITRRKQSEKELKKLNRTLLTLSACNQALVRASEESQLLNEICGNIVQLGEYDLAWVGFAQDDETKSIHPAAWAGKDEEKLKNLRFSWGEEKQKSPAGEAIRTGEYYALQGKENGSYLSLPLLAEGKTYGALTIERKAAAGFDAEEIRLLQELASDLSYGIVALRNQKERVKAEDALLSSNRRLETALEELKAAQQKMVQQERLTALGQMASGIAHDFNNAIAPIIGFAELLLFKPENLSNPDKVKEYISMIRMGATDATQVVKRMREFYRKREAGELSTPVQLNELVEGALRLTEPRWKHQLEAAGVNIQIQKDLSPVPPIMGNDGELREALTNLIFNALDAMPQGGTLSFRVYAQDGRCFLEVADTGTGMTEDVKKRLFEPFFSTKGPKGTGLGLAMVYGTVKRHDGNITVKSSPGEGSRFILSFPLGTETPREEPVPQDQVKKLPALRILLVDDEPLVLAVLKEYLVTDGHEVITATDGKEGYEKLQKEGFDLLITDLAMPEMSGDQLAKASKELYPQLPVLLVTGFADMLEGKPETIDQVLKKPVALDDLRNAVRALCGEIKPPSP